MYCKLETIRGLKNAKFFTSELKLQMFSINPMLSKLFLFPLRKQYIAHIFRLIFRLFIDFEFYKYRFFCYKISILEIIHNMNLLFYKN